MNEAYGVELLHILWPYNIDREFRATDGLPVKILKCGQYDDRRCRFTGSRIRYGDEIYNGEVVIWAGNRMPPGDFDTTVLHVTPCESAAILRSDGLPVPRVIVGTNKVLEAVYAGLKDGARGHYCSRHIAALENHERIALFTRLTADRLYRKYNEVLEILTENGQNWLETMYIVLLWAMGVPKNKEPFRELAARVPYKIICNERTSIVNLEAILLGTSGLLEIYEDDPYIRVLKGSFDHYRGKYNLISMRPAQWKNSRPGGNAALRIVQLAAFFMKQEFLINSVMQCRTVEDVQRLFDVEASNYWSTHYIPAQESACRPKRLGPERANVLGINFVVPVQFAYSINKAEENLKESALDLLEKIGRENNGIINSWRSKGVIVENAFDSQALLQLTGKFCENGLCWMCPVGKRVVCNAYKGVAAQKM